MGNSKGECRFCHKIFSGRGIGKHLLACGAKKEKDEMLNNRGKNQGYIYHLKISAGGLYWLHIEIEGTATLLNLDDTHMSAAEDWIRKAIEANKENGTIWYLANDYSLYAKLFKRKGDKSKARDYFHKSMDTFKECGADGWVEKKVEKEMASL